MLVDGVTVEYRRKDGSIGGAQARRDRFRRSGEQRLAGGEPVHGGRGPAQPPAGRGGVRQRAAAGGDRTEERRPTRTPRSGTPSTSSRPTGARSRRCSLPTRCWSSRTACRRASARSAPTRSGSSPGARSRARHAPATWPQLQVVLEGVFEKRRFLDLVRHFIVFEDDGGGRDRQEDGGLSPVPRGATWRWRRRCARRAGAAARSGSPRGAAAMTRADAGRRSRATGASAWSGTRRARARA